MVGEGGAPVGPPGPGAARGSHDAGPGYADITKLRELCAKHERLASKAMSQAAHIATRIEKLRHGAALLREKAEKILSVLPELDQEIVQHERDIQAYTQHTMGRPIGSDVTELHFRVRKLQQKRVDLEHRARTLEHKAAVRTQKAAELKIRADRFGEQAKLEQQEADKYRERADRLQLSAERALPPPPAPPAEAPAPVLAASTPPPDAPPPPAPEPGDQL